MSSRATGQLRGILKQAGAGRTGSTLNGSFSTLNGSSAPSRSVGWADRPRRSQVPTASTVSTAFTASTASTASTIRPSTSPSWLDRPSHPDHSTRSASGPALSSVPWPSRPPGYTGAPPPTDPSIPTSTPTHPGPAGSANGPSSAWHPRPRMSEPTVLPDSSDFPSARTRTTTRGPPETPVWSETSDPPVSQASIDKPKRSVRFADGRRPRRSPIFGQQTTSGTPQPSESLQSTPSTGTTTFPTSQTPQDTAPHSALPSDDLPSTIRPDPLPGDTRSTVPPTATATATAAPTPTPTPTTTNTTEASITHHSDPPDISTAPLGTDSILPETGTSLPPTEIEDPETRTSPPETKPSRQQAAVDTLGSATTPSPSNASSPGLQMRPKLPSWEHIEELSPAKTVYYFSPDYYPLTEKYSSSPTSSAPGAASTEGETKNGLDLEEQKLRSLLGRGSTIPIEIKNPVYPRADKNGDFHPPSRKPKPTPASTSSSSGSGSTASSSSSTGDARNPESSKSKDVTRSASPTASGAATSSSSSAIGSNWRSVPESELPATEFLSILSDPEKRRDMLRDDTTWSKYDPRRVLAVLQDISAARDSAAFESLGRSLRQDAAGFYAYGKANPATEGTEWESQKAAYDRVINFMKSQEAELEAWDRRRLKGKAKESSTSPSSPSPPSQSSSSSSSSI